MVRDFERRYFIEDNGKVLEGALLDDAEIIPLASWICKFIQPAAQFESAYFGHHPQGDGGFCDHCANIAAWMLMHCPWLDMARPPDSGTALGNVPGWNYQGKMQFADAKKLAHLGCSCGVFQCGAMSDAERKAEFGSCDSCARMAALFIAYCPWIDMSRPDIPSTESHSEAA